LPYPFFLRGVLEHRAGNTANGDSDIQTALALDPNKATPAACRITP
jgi:Flp pilus assembly protein TadD